MPHTTGGDYKSRPGHRKRRGRLRRRAVRDVQVAYQPQLDELSRFGEGIAGLYEGLGGQLSEIQGRFGPQYADIGADYQQGLAGLAELLGTATPPSEFAAAQGLFGTLGTGGLDLLASQQARNVGYGASASRQAAIDAANAQASLMARRTGITERMPAEILSHLGGLRDTERQYGLAQQEYELRKALADAQIGNDAGLLDFARSQAQDALARGGAGGFGRGGPGGGGQGGGSVYPPGMSGLARPPEVFGTPDAGAGGGLLSRFLGGELPWGQMTRGQRGRVRTRASQEGNPLAEFLGLPAYQGPGAVYNPRRVIRRVRRRVYGRPGRGRPRRGRHR